MKTGIEEVPLASPKKTLANDSQVRYNEWQKCKKAHAEAQALQLHIGQFLRGTAIPISDFGIASTKDNDFTDKPYPLVIIAVKRSFVNPLDLVPMG